MPPVAPPQSKWPLLGDVAPRMVGNWPITSLGGPHGHPKPSRLACKGRPRTKSRPAPAVAGCADFRATPQWLRFNERPVVPFALACQHFWNSPSWPNWNSLNPALGRLPPTYCASSAVDRFKQRPTGCKSPAHNSFWTHFGCAAGCRRSEPRRTHLRSQSRQFTGLGA